MKKAYLCGLSYLSMKYQLVGCDRLYLLLLWTIEFFVQQGGMLF
jgi:hypothetical protein